MNLPAFAMAVVLLWISMPGRDRARSRGNGSGCAEGWSVIVRYRDGLDRENAIAPERREPGGSAAGGPRAWGPRSRDRFPAPGQRGTDLPVRRRALALGARGFHESRFEAYRARHERVRKIERDIEEEHQHEAAGPHRADSIPPAQRRATGSKYLTRMRAWAAFARAGL